ncbi:MAG: Yip1 family protein [Candidatus Methylopumilus sp.]
MNLSTMFKLFWTPTNGWRELLASSPSIPRLFLLHVVPLSCIPTLMILYAGKSQDAFLLVDILSTTKMMYVGTVFFLVQLIAVPIMALIIRHLGEVADINPTYQSAFTLAAVAPTPIWLSSVSLLAPNFLVLVFIGTLALMASGGLIFYGLPEVFDIKNKENAIMYFGGIVVAGMIALVFLMLSTLVIWGSIQNLNL